MRHLLQKFLSSIVIVLSIVLCASTSFAANDNTALTLSDLETRYNLKDIDPSDVPSNIKPIEFKSIEECDEFLAKLKRENDEQEKIFKQKLAMLRMKELKEKTSIMVNSENIKSNSYLLSSTDKTGSQTKTVENNVFCKYQVTAIYKYHYSSYYKQNLFSSCVNVTSSLNGLSPGIEYTQTSYYSSIIDSGRTLACTVYGHEKDYLLIKGSIKLNEYDKKFYVEFYNP